MCYFFKDKIVIRDVEYISLIVTKYRLIFLHLPIKFKYFGFGLKCNKFGFGIEEIFLLGKPYAVISSLGHVQLGLSYKYSSMRTNISYNFFSVFLYNTFFSQKKIKCLKRLVHDLFLLA